MRTHFFAQNSPWPLNRKIFLTTGRKFLRQKHVEVSVAKYLYQSSNKSLEVGDSTQEAEMDKKHFFSEFQYK